MKKKLIACALLLTSINGYAIEYTVGQKNKEFSEVSLTIKVGDVINFENNDSFFHNIFSLSDVQGFDLGSYPQGESRPVIFDAKGTVVIECAIHPKMQLDVIVE